MNKKLELEIDNINNIKIVWDCRFHPTDSWHEVGCPHQKWSNKDLQRALESAKKSEIYLLSKINNN